MKTEKIVWGLILVFIGGILLLQNFNVIDFHWRAVVHLWPLILIIVGANMIINRSAHRAGAFAGIAITVACLCFIAYQGVYGQYEPYRWMHFRYNNDDNDNDDRTTSANWKKNSFSEPYLSTMKNARLEISGGATTYKIQDSSSNLIDINVKHRDSGYSLNQSTSDSSVVLKFDMKSGKKKLNFSDSDETAANMKLNANPVWDINLEMGAGECDFDLSKFKVSGVRLEGGAASFKIKLGMPQTVTNVTAETGVAEVKIAVPKEAACQIKVDSGLSSKDFNGFEKQEDGSYSTSNFKTSSQKIIISLEGGLSDFNVSRY
ncbi:MAG: hypothetical protein K0S09_637 [Sphingobacteriaceae bacterium]|jgi:hypothetical protein|nr:hypothetical protein [Sphingobacteriaceae bacterium]